MTSSTIAETAERRRTVAVATTGTVLALNRAGTIIYRGLLGGQPAQTIAEALASRFGISDQRALADVETFMASPPAQSSSSAADAATDDKSFQFAAHGDGFVVFAGDRQFLEIGPEGETLTIGEGLSAPDARSAVRWVTAKLAALHGTPAFHASAVRLGDGAAIAFAGRSGAGKTTLARSLAAHGARLICEDSCILWPHHPDGRARLLPFEEPASRWADEILTTAVPGRPIRVTPPAPQYASSIPIDRVLLVDRRRRSGRFLRMSTPLGPTAAAGSLLGNLFWANLDWTTCNRAAGWAAWMAKRLSVAELTSPDGVNQLSDAGRIFVDTYAI